MRASFQISEHQHSKNFQIPKIIDTGNGKSETTVEMNGLATIMIQFTLFGIFGTMLLVSADLSFRQVSPLKHSSKASVNFLSSPYLQLTTNDTPSAEHEMKRILRSMRGGGIVRSKARTAPGTTTSSTTIQNSSVKSKRKLLLVASIATVYGLYHTRSTWIDFFNKEKIQASVVQSLESLNSFPYLYSRLIYTVSMALWEAMGMSTIPVETAAGMVFGWSGIYWSGIGKLLGACLAFGLGRGALSSLVEKKLSSNAFLNLVRDSTSDNPLLVLILIKLSCFPETVKNLGSSMLTPIRWWMFILGTAVHGCTFTALWTYLGVDTAARLKDAEGLLPPDQRLKVLLTLAVINGIVVSPLSMVYWMRTLKQKQNNTMKAKARGRRNRTNT